MHKRCFKLILVLALMSLVLGSSVMPVLGHNYGRGGYDYDQNIDIENPDWMASLPDPVRISELSIPGTHDTMAKCSNVLTCGGAGIVWWVRCQSFTLDDQLRIGIRALDIRCRHYGDRFAIHHGANHLDGMWFDTDVLEPVIDFLTEHPTETVLMRIKPEYEPAPDCPFPGFVCNEKTFAQVLVDYINDTGAPVWQPPEGIDRPNPTLGEARGKIVILDGFSNGNKYGINWFDTSYVHIQDNFDLKKGANDMINKWDDILAHLNDADKGSMDDIYINFLSGVGDGADMVGGVIIWPYPWFIASGHISESWAEPGTNGGHQTWWGREAPDQCGPFYHPNGVKLSDRCVLTGMPDLVLDKWINDNPVSKRTGRMGIIMADFPSDLLADAIIDLNPRNKESTDGGGGGCLLNSF